MTTNTPANGTLSLRNCMAEKTLEQRLACLADAGPEAISERLTQIKREWSAGRATKAAIGLIITAGLGLTALVGPWGLILPAIGALFLLQYLFMRRSLLGAAFCGMGFRSGADIDIEKYALMTLRGDFRNLPTVYEIVSKDDISRLEGEGGIVVDVEDEPPDAQTAAAEVAQAAKG